MGVNWLAMTPLTPKFGAALGCLFFAGISVKDHIPLS